MATGIFREEAVNSFMRFARNPLKFSSFLFWKLPIAWLAGVRLHTLQPGSCTVRVPFRWLSQNPFRSTYFACLGMAAEMSTGLPAMMYVQAVPKRVSMLVTGLEATFVKKAVRNTYFTCDTTDIIKAAIEQALQQQESVTVTVNSHGKSEDGTLIASFAITWSFKQK